MTDQHTGSTDRTNPDRTPYAGHRAPKGGCWGLSGTWYEGGQFLPASERPAPFVKAAVNPTGAAWHEADRLLGAAARGDADRIAASPANLWVLRWLRRHADRVRHLVFSPGHGTYVEVPCLTGDEEPGSTRTVWTFTSAFLADMHRALTEGSLHPWDLTDRQFGMLAEIYARDHGRRGSKAYGAALDVFHHDAQQGLQDGPPLPPLDARTPAQLQAAATTRWTAATRPAYVDMMARVPAMHDPEHWARQGYAEHLIYDEQREAGHAHLTARTAAAAYGQHLQRTLPGYRPTFRP